MLTLVYISTARGEITQEMCENILAASRANNARDGITGLLVAGKRRFLQALEGPDAAVREAYRRIALDRRHFACVIIGEHHGDQRQFGPWAMGYASGGDPDDVAGLEAMVASLVAPLDDANLRAHFTGFARLQAHAA